MASNISQKFRKGMPLLTGAEAAEVRNDLSIQDRGIAAAAVKKTNQEAMQRAQKTKDLEAIQGIYEKLGTKPKE